MNGTLILEIVLSLVFIYFFLSLAVSGIVEIVINWKSKRGLFLYKAIDKVLNDPLNKNYADLLYEHPLISSLKKNYKSMPSYISSKLFSSCMIDLIIDEGKYINNGKIQANKKKSLASFINGLAEMKNSEFKRLLNSFLNESSNIDELKSLIANWYDDYMDRISGWYKRDTERITLLAAIAFTVILNINSIEIIKTVKDYDSVRQSLISNVEFTLASLDTSITNIEKVKLIEQFIDSSDNSSRANKLTVSADSIKNDISGIKNNISQLQHFFTYHNLPIGWNLDRNKCKTKKEKSGIGKIWTTICLIWNNITFIQIIGWVITIFAITLGAPFYFNILSNIMSLRNAGKKPKTEK